MKRYEINTPVGTRDRIYDECKVRRRLENALISVFEESGFSEVSSPTMEYMDVVMTPLNPLPQEILYKISECTGRMLVLRPDMTTPIARIAATKIDTSALPAKFYYMDKVFRASREDTGRPTEIMQGGVERIGNGGIEADVDTILLAAKALRACTDKKFHIEIGHAGYFKSLAQKLDISDAEFERMRGYIENKNFAALSDMLLEYGDTEATRAINKLSRMFGGMEILEGDTSLDYLKELYTKLSDAGIEDCISIDLGLVHKIDYYTGIVFRGYVEGCGVPVMSGGRYDSLIGSFGRDMPAIGFAIDVDAIAEASQSEKAEDTSRENVLRIALTKGRLEKKTTAALEKMGLDCSELSSGSRKLIYRVPNYNLEIVLAKAADVITYVEHGVCDMGVVGKDTIMEQGSSFYEMLDLGFGKCRFALATREGYDFYGSYKTRRIASKYPKVAREYFAHRGMDVDVIKIEGSVELGPLLDIADAIVDIVETGSTLVENGLEPIADIHAVSARLIVNIASMKLYKDEIFDFLGKLECVLGEENNA